MLNVLIINGEWSEIIAVRAAFESKLEAFSGVTH